MKGFKDLVKRGGVRGRMGVESVGGQLGGGTWRIFSGKARKEFHRYGSGSANASVKVFLKTHSRLLKLAKSKN